MQSAAALPAALARGLSGNGEVDWPQTWDTSTDAETLWAPGFNRTPFPHRNRSPKGAGGPREAPSWSSFRAFARAPKRLG
jgi:hypothetical protein